MNVDLVMAEAAQTQERWTRSCADPNGVGIPNRMQRRPRSTRLPP